MHAGFVRDHVSFHEGKTNIGYGLEDKFAFKDEPKTITLERYRELLADYSVEKVEPLSGVPARELRYLASLYADPKRKVMSFWCMGFNQHTRGTWINNLVYNIHLLVGKIATPGNSPFSLTGQPSACGTVREVGTLTNRLPHGEVTDEKSRKMAADIWGVPVERIPAKPTYNTMEMFRAVDRGDIRFIWIQTTNPMLTLPKLRRYRDGLKKDDRFVVVSDVYPTPTTDVADVVLPAAMWIEREGMWGNSERRTQHFERMLTPPGEAIVGRLADDRGGAAHGLREALPLERGHPRPGDLEGVLALPARAGPRDGALRGAEEAARRHVALRERERDQVAVQRPVRSRPPRAPSTSTVSPTTAPGSGSGPTRRRRRCRTRSTRSGSTPGRVLEHWHSGSLTRRVPVLHQAVPASYVELHPADARKLGIGNGQPVRLTTRRGALVLPAQIDGRARPPEGQVFVPFFDEGLLINELTLDAYCPISGQPDYKKCAVKVERA